MYLPLHLEAEIWPRPAAQERCCGQSLTKVINGGAGSFSLPFPLPAPISIPLPNNLLVKVLALLGPSSPAWHFQWLTVTGPEEYKEHSYP